MEKARDDFKNAISVLYHEIKDNMIKSGNEFFAKRATSPTYHTFHNAPTVILISAEEKNPGAQFDCAACAKHLLCSTAAP